MARKVITTVELTDDIDGGKADQTVSFSWDGTNYELDLSKKNAAAFAKALKPYLDQARRAKTTTRGRSRSAGGSSRAARNDLADVRAWARANGYDISERGRVPAAVLEAYDGK